MKPCISKELRKSARGQRCTLRTEFCNEYESDVMLCHVPLKGMAGWSQKAHDFHAMYACYNCHNWFDVTARGDPSRWKEAIRAVFETQSIMYEQGLMIIKR